MKNVTKIYETKSLVELAELLNQIDDHNKNVDDQQDEMYVDTTSLPTFGGNDLVNTLGVWSWDASNVLVTNDYGWIIENRCECGEAAFNCICK